MPNKTTSLILCMLTALFLLLSSSGNVLNPGDGELETGNEQPSPRVAPEPASAGSSGLPGEGKETLWQSTPGSRSGDWPSPLLFSSFVGGDDYDSAYDIALDSENNIYMTGWTYSEDFPTTSGAYNETFGGGVYDVFVCKIDPTGSTLLWSTYVGGSDKDQAFGITLDSENNVYVTGYTESSDFPTTPGAYNENYIGGWHSSYANDAFVFKLSSDGGELLYSTFLAGDEADSGRGISLDSENNAYIVGHTQSYDFPTTEGCFDESHNDGTKRDDHDYDVFVSKLNENGSELLYSTFIGSSKSEGGRDISVDVEKNAYIVGTTGSANFPTTEGCYDATYNGESHEKRDVFICKVNHNGSELLFSTFLGGSEGDQGYNLVLDAESNICVAGITISPDFPTSAGCFDNSYENENDDVPDTFLTKFDKDGKLVFSTFLGGNRSDIPGDICTDAKGDLYLTGTTNSHDFPVTENCFDDTHHEKEIGEIAKDAFVTKFRSDGKSISYSTFIKGESFDGGEGIAADSDGNVFVIGSTQSADFPVAERCYDDTFNGYKDLVAFNLYLGSEAEIESILPRNPSTADSVHFVANYTGSATVERYVWRTEDTELYNGTSPEFTTPPMNLGEHTVFFTVQDEYGLWSLEDSITFSVHLQPVANITLLSPSPALLGKSILFEGQGIDDNIIVRFRWTSSLDGVFFNSYERSFSTDNLSQGKHIITLEVLDSFGAWSEAVNVTLVVHTKPVAQIVSVSPSPATEKKDVTFRASGTDDWAISRYVWRSSLDGEFYNGTEPAFKSVELSKGTHTIFLKVQDDNGAWSEEVSVVLVVKEGDSGGSPGFDGVVVLLGMVLGIVGFRWKRGRE